METPDGGQKQHCCGVYLICNGGYHEWVCFISLHKHQLPGIALEVWSKVIELVRKDIECVFGIMKKDFIFKGSNIRPHNPEEIHRAFLTS